MRRRLLGAVAALGVAVSFAIGVASATAAPEGRVVCRLQDPDLVESSGLVARGGLLVTVNDSGDTGRVFTLDATTCETVGVTTWSQSPTDVEAIAPSGDASFVFVGDIGDNAAARSEVAIARVPVGRGDRTVTPASSRVTYPGGPQDAETLMRDPVSGRLVIVTKTFLGGDVLLAPSRTLSTTAVNRFTKVGEVLSTATDGAFFPDGRHVVVRSYTRAAVYTWPDLEEVDTFDLPEQQQGEGLAVDDYSSVLLGSEGLNAPVLRFRLPAAVAEAVEPPAPTGAGPSTSGEAGGVEASDGAVGGAPGDAGDDAADERALVAVAHRWGVRCRDAGRARSVPPSSRVIPRRGAVS